MSQHELTRTVVILAMVVVLLVVLVVELRILRTRRKKKVETGDLPDRAHTALLTTKAIAETVGRGGVRSEEADDLIREAEGALRMRNYRVAIELAGKAKSILRAAKLRYHAQGDLVRVPGAPAEGSISAEVTTKEKLTKELPPNYVQSKFSMNLAREGIDAARARGQGVQDAERLLRDAQVSFDAQNYDAALAQAVRARRALETAAVAPAPLPSDVVSAASGTRTITCTSCGAPASLDDAFCRKCGIKVERPRTCASCGADVAVGDTFCRKCGTKVA